MHRAVTDSFRCPYTREKLRLDGGADRADVESGALVSESGASYPIRDGIAHLIDWERESFSEEEKREKDYYETTARSYDEVMDWLFKSFGEDETTVRSKMLDLLELTP